VLSALDSSSKVNEAYRALRDPIARTKHLLSLYGYSVEQSKQVPMELLELVMNVQEQVAAIQGGFGNPSELAPTERDLNNRIIAHKKEIDDLRTEWAAVKEHAQTREPLGADEVRILSSLTKSLATRAYLQTLYDTLSAAKEGRTLVLKH
jgi:molecular chaperone HscB